MMQFNRYFFFSCYCIWHSFFLLLIFHRWQFHFHIRLKLRFVLSISHIHAISHGLSGMKEENSLMNIDEELFLAAWMRSFLIGLKEKKTSSYQTNLNIFEQTIYRSLHHYPSICEWISASDEKLCSTPLVQSNWFIVRKRLKSERDAETASQH